MRGLKPPTSYTLHDGYSFRAGPARASSPGPPSLREVDGLLGPRRARESGRWGGVSALGARTIFRLSLRECQPDRGQNRLKRTPSASGSRPWSRGREGRGVGRSFLRVVLVHVQVVLHCFQQQRRAERIARAFKDVPEVTRDVTRPASRGVVAGKSGKSRTWCDHAGSPFGRP